jgi:hypothetical protein
MDHPIDTLALWFTAVGTVAVAILAIWGDWFRNRFAGPKLELSLRPSLGDLNTEKSKWTCNE